MPHPMPVVFDVGVLAALLCILFVLAAYVWMHIIAPRRHARRVEP